MKIINESCPLRCEICHKSDYFDPIENYCSRCREIVNQLMNVSENKWKWRIYDFISISCISIIGLIICSLGMLLYNANKPVPVKKINLEEATKLAEQYVLDNGYTDQPRWQVIGKYLILNSTLQYNYQMDNEEATSYDEILKNRFNMVERKHDLTVPYENYNSVIIGWKVSFQGKSSDEDKLEVFMDLYGQNIKIKPTPKSVYHGC